jgi:hypothetical protein
MAYGLQVDGAGSWWDTNSTYDQAVYEETVTSDIATQSQTVQTTASNDGWTDWFKGVASSVISYSLKKDAVQTGAELQQTMAAPVYQQQPVYLQSNAAGTSVGISKNMLLLLAAGVGVYMLASK